TVTIPDPDGLNITLSGQTRSVGIGSVRSACATNASNCDQAIESYAQRAVSYILEAAPFTAAQLQAVVRSHAYLEELKPQLGAGESFVSSPFTDDLEMVCYRNLPQGRRPIVTTALAALGLDQASSLAACEANAHRELPPLANQWRDLPAQGLGILKDI